MAVNFQDLPNTTTPINSTNLNKAQTDILETIGTDTNDWSSSGTYSTGDTVIYNGKIYENQTGTNTSTTPDSDTTNWTEISLLDKILDWEVVEEWS